MIAISIILACAVAYLVGVSSYLLFLTLGAFLLHRKPIGDAPALRIAVVIPAHDEELQIAACVKHVQSANYPPDNLDIFVIADNCSDGTAQAAIEAGAVAIERHDLSLRGKGQALDWFLKDQRSRLEASDIIAIVDADTQVDADFCRAISAAFADESVSAIQGFHSVSNPEANWRTALTFAAFSLVNGLRPAGRTFWGGTGDLKGNGMAFRSSLLLRTGWPAHSIVEDMEFSMRLLLDGIRVRYAPHAIVISEMPTSNAQADPQRRRWESGRFSLIALSLPRLVTAFLRAPRWCFLDAILEFLVPPLSLLVFLELLLLTVSIFLQPAFAPALIACGIVIALYVASGLILSKAPARVWFALAAAPLFLLWKIPFYLKLALTKKPQTWERTQRQAEINRDSNQ